MHRKYGAYVAYLKELQGVYLITLQQASQIMSLSPLKVPRVRQRTGSGFAGYDTLQICSPLCRC